MSCSVALLMLVAALYRHGGLVDTAIYRAVLCVGTFP